MRGNEKLFVAIVCVALISFAGAPQEKAEITAGKELFSQTNIWYENPKKIYSTNYHIGTMIPVGTKVRIVRLTKKSVQFQPLDSETTFTMTHVRRHSTIAFQEVFDRYFSEQNPIAGDGRFHQFSAEEQENVKRGTIAEGMCKKAVVMAYGYPPSNATPTLALHKWTYWITRFQKIVTVFEGDKVVRTGH